MFFIIKIDKLKYYTNKIYNIINYYYNLHNVTKSYVNHYNFSDFLYFNCIKV